jgi:integrase
MAVLTGYVRGLKAIEQRNAGEPVETPQVPYAPTGAPAADKGGTLRDALEGWKKERERPEDGVHEYTRAIEMFIELHGNIAIADIKRSHASQFRDALRQVPKTRKGSLLKAGLLELRRYGEEHPSAPKVPAATVNKQLGAVQAIISWGYRHGLVPDDVPQTDPFKDMRVEGEQSTRDAFDPHGLQAVFDAPLFTELKIPAGGKGPAAVWLPLLAVFMGGRQGEFASLRVSDVREDAETRIPLMWIVRDTTAGKSVKTDAGERVVPIHPQIIQLGFLDYVANRKAEDGEKAWLFPAVAPDQRGGRKAWAKWWGRYLRDHIGVDDRSLVFHSFRHGFQDALRRATPDEELRDALAGRSSAGKSVSRGYGAKQMLQRWGVQKLHETICNVSFPGLDLSRVRPLNTPTTARINKRK